MPLNKKLKKQITDSFSKIRSPVEVMLFVSGKYPKVEKEMETALKEILSLNKKLSFSKYKVSSSMGKKYELKKGPAIIIHGKEKGKVRYFGFPSGYLFPIFVMDIVEASVGGKKAASVKKKIHLEVFAMPPDKYSPIAGKIAHDVALASNNVTADIIDALLFPELVRKYKVKEIPTTIINDRKLVPGVIMLPKLVKMLK